MALKQADYLAQLIELLPPGPAWMPEPGEPLYRWLEGLAAEFARLDQRCADLLAESLPQSARELLAEWEATAGLPDDCTIPGTQTVAERRAAVLGKLLAVGGQSIPYYKTILAALGYPDARIEEFKPHIHGRARHGSRYGNWLWGRIWRVHLPATTVTRRRYGSAVHGEPFSVYGDSAVACILNRMKPAHTELLITYGD